eukprot:6131200-Pleurochrysis_carterae.AAC.2
MLLCEQEHGAIPVGSNVLNSSGTARTARFAMELDPHAGGEYEAESAFTMSYESRHMCACMGA